jgi:hypothetical protein
LRPGLDQQSPRRFESGEARFFGAETLTGGHCDGRETCSAEKLYGETLWCGKT